MVYFAICTPLPSVSVSLLACWASCLQFMLELMGGLCMYVESGHCLGCALNGKNSFVPLFSNCQINDSVWHVIQVEFYLDYGMHLYSFIQNSGDRIEG